MRFEEEGENLMDRLVSREERIIPKDMNFITALTYKNRQKLYEKRLKLTKALPIIQHEMSELESENESKISLYITQKSEFTASLHMLIDQIDSILRRDDSQQQTAGLAIVKNTNILSFRSGSMGRDACKNNTKKKQQKNTRYA